MHFLGLPEGVVPIFLAVKTQELFALRTDEDVTVDSPYKYIKKEDVLKDLQERAAVCDFHPIRQTMIVRYSSTSLSPIFSIFLFPDRSGPSIWQCHSSLYQFQYSFLSRIELSLSTISWTTHKTGRVSVTAQKNVFMSVQNVQTVQIYITASNELCPNV